jgi:uncharacterized SAM-binding protein YcdF (DUF218 family)
MILLGVALGIAILCFVSAGDIYDYQDSVDGVHLPSVDAIVVLAGGRGRIAQAGDRWYRYWELSRVPWAGTRPKAAERPTPLLYFSGTGPKTTWPSLRKQMRPGILPAISAQNVILETESENTVENAIWAARYAKERGWQSVLLITSRYHMKRSRHIFSTLVPVHLETLSVYQEPFEPGEWRDGLHGIRVTMLEYLKYLYYTKIWRNGR